jgi:uncharacterized protein YqgV (UPF0045/DUF77 family)
LLVHFNIYRLDSSPLAQEVAEVVRTLQTTSLKFQPGPMGIRVQGQWDEVMAAIRKCHQHLIRKHLRVLTTIVIDDDQNVATFSLQQGEKPCTASASS